MYDGGKNERVKNNGGKENVKRTHEWKFCQMLGNYFFNGLSYSRKLKANVCCMSSIVIIYLYKRFVRNLLNDELFMFTIMLIIEYQNCQGHGLHLG